MVGGVLIGVAIAGLCWLLAKGGGREGEKVAGEAPECVVTVFLLRPDGEVGRAIDAATGRSGFSHAIAGGCELNAEGEPLVYDCRMGHGVERVPLRRYEDRERVAFTLDGCDGRELLGGLRARVGQHYGEDGSVNCAALVCDALPPRHRERVLAEGVCSPNAIARAFGVAEEA